MTEIRGISLCAGIGMEALGMEWAGIEVGALCEIDPWCQSVLSRHWPDVPIIGDIRNVTRESIARIPAHSESKYDPRGRFESATITDAGHWRGREEAKICPGRHTVSVGRPIIDVVAGGIPCQGHSVAGRRKGGSDKRNLWPEFRRIVEEIRPTWAVLENVPGLLRSDGGWFFAGVLSDLAAMGYDAGWCMFGAVDMGAPHKRDRLFVIAHAQGIRPERSRTTRQRRHGFTDGDNDAHTPEPGREGRDSALLAEAENGLPAGLYGPFIPDWAGGGWRMPPGLTEPTTRRERTVSEHVCPMDARGAGGLVRPLTKGERRQRIKALGNCNPPQMYYEIFRAIMEAENVRS